MEERPSGIHLCLQGVSFFSFSFGLNYANMHMELRCERQIYISLHLPSWAFSLSLSIFYIEFYLVIYHSLVHWLLFFSLAVISLISWSRMQ